MSVSQSLMLAAVFLVTSAISVVTGSTSVITVPVMFQAGIDPRAAIATNMFALIFMSIGGALPLRGTIDLRRLPVLVFLTMTGSLLGAWLLAVIPSSVIPTFVSIAIIGLALFSTLYRGFPQATVSRQRVVLGYVLTFVLGIYGGLFSGGYVTILTAVFVATFGMSFVEAIATTKVVNIFSSGIATSVFMWQGLVDYRLGIFLAAIMFAGAMLGGRYARRLNEAWLKRIYLAAVWLLALKALLFDLPKPNHHQAPPRG